MYIMTLRELFTFKGFLDKVVQFRWFGTPTNSAPFLLLELGVEYIKDHNSSWIKMISKDSCISKIVLMTKLFFRIFWEKILISFIIMLESHLHLNELTVFYFCEVLDTFLSVTSCWSSAFRKNIGWSQLDDCLCNLSTWTYIGIVHSA